MPIASGSTVAPPSVASGSLLQSGSGSTASGSLVASGSLLDQLFVPSVAVPPQLPVRVAITEVAWMGSNVSTADEWVEIAAFGSGSRTAPYSLSGWTLVSVKAGVETTIARLKPEHVVSSGSVFVIANTPAASSRIAVEPALVTTGMSLPNTQLLLRLKDGSGAIVDEVDDGVGAPFAGSNPSGGTKATMERIAPWGSGSVVTNWKTATLSLGFDDGPAMFGTPGVLGPSKVVETIDDGDGDENGDEDLPIGVPVVPVTAPPIIRLTEVLSNPIGADVDEWIEIGSFDATPIDLTEVDLRSGTTRFRISGTLQLGEHRRYGKLQSGLSLPNSSGTIEVLWRDKIIDVWTYGETVEGVSLGRAMDGVVTSQCVPSPDLPNANAPLDPQIIIQTSSPSAGKLSLNLEARVPAGSLAGASCSWSYPDGFTNASCNPPSHSLPGPLTGDVFLTVVDYCGNTLIRTLHVEVAGKNDPKAEGESFACMPTSFTGVVVSEFVPNPAGEEADGEWIELANPSAEMKPLCGWSIDDEERGSDPYRLDHVQIPPGDRLVLPRSETEISLNNDRDAVRLFSPLRGGGSGAIEIVRYEAASEDESFARRDDGVWLWTDPTPEAANEFAPVRWPESVQVEVVAAMPNPEGKDTEGGEWIEIKNTTKYPLPLTGWRLETASSETSLNGIILSPFERYRLEDVLSLPNTDGYVRLADRDNVPVSTLAWSKSGDGKEIQQAEAKEYVADLSFVGTDDCRMWHLIDVEKSEHIIIHSELIFNENIECKNSISDLMKGQKIEQKIYSNSKTGSVLFLHGTDIASLLLRHGIARVDPNDDAVFHQQYLLDQHEARNARRGIWADHEATALIDDAITLTAMRETIARDGFQIEFSHDPGVVQSGTILAISTNIPSTISIAIGTGALQPYVGSVMIDHDVVLHVEAVADIQNAAGSDISNESFQTYAMLKSRYPELRISEVYPSPKTGEAEWVEVWNPNDEAVSLLGWAIDDVEEGGSKPLHISDGSVLQPGEFFRLEYLSIVWNNDGDDVRLIAPNGKLSHAVTYGSVKKGAAVAMLFSDDGRQSGQCPTMHATPGAENRCAEALPKAKKQTTKKTTVEERKHDVRYRNLLVDQVRERMQRAIFGRLIGVSTAAYPFASLMIFVCAVALLLILSGAIARFVCIQRDCP